MPVISNRILFGLFSMAVLLLSQPAMAVAVGGGLTDFAGRYSYSLDGDRVTIKINRIENRSDVITTGVLRIELWAGTSPYSGGLLTGTQLARIQTQQIAGLSNRLPPNSSFRNIEFTTGFTTQPAGSNVFSLLLTEYSDSCTVNSGYCPIAYETFFGNSGGEFFATSESTEYTSIYGFQVRPISDGVFDGEDETAFVNGSLTSSDYTFDGGSYLDAYEFTLQHDSEVYINLSSNQFGAFMYLVRVNAAHEPISVQTIDGVSNQAEFDGLLSRGTYWIGASNSNPFEEGSYRVDIEIESTPSLDIVNRVPTQFGLGIEVSNNPYVFGILTATDPTLSDGSYIDAFQITINETRSYRIDLQSIEFDPYLIVARVLPNGALDPLFTFENDDADGFNSRIEEVLPPGTYWVAVNTFAPGALGGYLLSMRPSP